VKLLPAILSVICVLPAWADDLNNGRPITLKISPQLTKAEENSTPLTETMQAVPANFWIEFNVGACFEFIGRQHFTGGISYAQVFDGTIGVDLQAGFVYAWPIHSRYFEWDMMVRPYVGFGSRSFTGGHGSDGATGLQINTSDLDINTYYLGVTLGAGDILSTSDSRVIVYLTTAIGLSDISELNVTSTTGIQEQMFDQTNDMYISFGAGIECVLGMVTFRIEGGWRTFGTPERNAGQPIPGSRAEITAGYLLLAVGISY
jgi:hypothetical protein